MELRRIALIYGTTLRPETAGQDALSKSTIPVGWVEQGANPPGSRWGPNAD